MEETPALPQSIIIPGLLPLLNSFIEGLTDNYRLQLVNYLNKNLSSVEDTSPKSPEAPTKIKEIKPDELILAGEIQFKLLQLLVQDYLPEDLQIYLQDKYKNEAFHQQAFELTANARLVASLLRDISISETVYPEEVLDRIEEMLQISRNISHALVYFTGSELDIAIRYFIGSQQSITPNLNLANEHLVPVICGSNKELVQIIGLLKQYELKKILDLLLENQVNIKNRGILPHNEFGAKIIPGFLSVRPAFDPNKLDLYMPELQLIRPGDPSLIKDLASARFYNQGDIYPEFINRREPEITFNKPRVKRRQLEITSIILPKIQNNLRMIYEGSLRIAVEKTQSNQPSEIQEAWELLSQQERDIQYVFSYIESHLSEINATTSYTDTKSQGFAQTRIFPDLVSQEMIIFDLDRIGTYFKFCINVFGKEQISGQDLYDIRTIYLNLESIFGTLEIQTKEAIQREKAADKSSSKLSKDEKKAAKKQVEYLKTLRAIVSTKQIVVHIIVKYIETNFPFLTQKNFPGSLPNQLTKIKDLLQVIKKTNRSPLIPSLIIGIQQIQEGTSKNPSIIFNLLFDLIPQLPFDYKNTLKALLDSLNPGDFSVEFISKLTDPEDQLIWKQRINEWRSLEAGK